MPGYKGHLAGGCVAFSLAMIMLYHKCPSSTVAFQWLGSTLAGSLFPDIDIKSKGQKYFYWIVLLIIGLLTIKQQYQLLALCSVFSVLPMLVKHRGLFHRVWFVIGMPLSVWFLVSTYMPGYTYPMFYYTLFFVLGALSHLWLDLGIKQMLRRW